MVSHLGLLERTGNIVKQIFEIKRSEKVRIFF